MEIDQLQGQINSLTNSVEGLDESVSNGGGMSLPTTVTDNGPLRRQLIKMQQTMAVGLHVTCVGVSCHMHVTCVASHVTCMSHAWRLMSMHVTYMSHVLVSHVTCIVVD